MCWQSSILITFVHEFMWPLTDMCLKEKTHERQPSYTKSADGLPLAWREETDNKFLNFKAKFHINFATKTKKLFFNSLMDVVINIIVKNKQ
uniref:Uncharacterized protein n=1 Tax=Panagrellus redivivus TaxID=6233 RepID=A0A7E4VEN3_PANRE